MSEAFFDQEAKNWDRETVRLRLAAAVASKITAKISFKPDMRALEFGCGTGLVGFQLLPRLSRLTFCDLSRAMLDEVERKIKDQKIDNADALRLDLSREDGLPGQYDLIFSSMALHHIDDFKSVVAKLVGGLKAGGFLAVADLDSEDGSFHGEVQAFHHGFNRGEMKSLVEQNGLVEVEALTAHEIVKEVDGAEKTFPVFLVIGRMPD